MPEPAPSQPADARPNLWSEWISVIKLLIGSIAATAITQIATCHLKTVELGQTDRTSEREFLNKHFDVLIDPATRDRRLTLAQYCATVFGGRWTAYYEDLRKENEKALEELAKRKTDLEAKKMEAAEGSSEDSAAQATQAKVDLKLAKVVEQITGAQTARDLAGLAPVGSPPPVPVSTPLPDTEITGWCYAGKYIAGQGWQDATIQVPPDGSVAPNSDVVAATSLYLRTSPRTQSSPKAGPQRGVLQEGAILHVRELQTFPDSHSVWLNVQVKTRELYVPITAQSTSS